ncbi:MAG: HD domain-containing protein [Acidobacteriota bacterium]|nr:MAG: HD domain-containing protein [Acidobacteriota bacterium]
MLRRNGDGYGVSGQRLREDTVYHQSVFQTLRRAGVTQLRLGRGLDAAAGLQLLEFLIACEPLQPGETRAIGTALLQRMHFGSQQPEATSDRAATARLDQVEIGAGFEAFLDMTSQTRNAAHQLDEFVSRIIDTLDETAASTWVPPAAENAESRLFEHSLRVALLALTQARTLGIQGRVLHEIGLAALLHDVGKLDLPQPTLECTGRLDESEWQIFRQHPEWGASRLASVEQIGQLPVVVAYEHHLRWDGEPSYPTLSKPRRPCLASQLTAVSDTYDAVLSGEPRPGPTAHHAALAVVEHRAGHQLDPLLARHFVEMMRSADA